jgi:hypothetical protein
LFAGIEAWTFEQDYGEAVFIPAGCPHQVRNLKVRVLLRFLYCQIVYDTLSSYPHNWKAIAYILEPKQGSGGQI